MADGREHPIEEGPGRHPELPGWAGWFAWAWVSLVLAAVLAEALGLVDLRLALDFQRHL